MLEERVTQNFKSFSADHIYEWNIDGQSETSILQILQQMTMVSTTYQTTNDASDEAITNLLIAGFTGQLKGWWDNYLSSEEKNVILTSVKTEPDGTPILYEGSSIPDSVNTLIFTIIKHFVGDPSLWKDRSAELLSNLKCRTLSDFRWYRDNFLQRVLTRDDANQPFWKEKFLAGLPKSLGDKVREKLRNQNDGNIPYERLTYGQLVSSVQRTTLKIWHDDKIKKQLAKVVTRMLRTFRFLQAAQA